MLLNYRNFLIGSSAISLVLCDGLQDSDDGFSIFDSSSTHEHLEHEPLLIPNSDSNPLTTAQSSTGDEDGSPTDLNPVIWQPLEHSGDDADEEFISLFSFRVLATPESSNRSTASATLSSSTTSSVSSAMGAANPIQAALDWLTSTTNSTSSGGKSASATSKSGASWASPHRTTTTSTTTTTTTDPAKAALDWLTSGLDGESATTTATTTDSKHSSAVSSILSELEATHTSAAAANRLRLGLW